MNTNITNNYPTFIVRYVDMKYGFTAEIPIVAMTAAHARFKIEGSEHLLMSQRNAVVVDVWEEIPA